MGEGFVQESCYKISANKIQRNSRTIYSLVIGPSMKFIKNKYRVLLTRGREGLIIFIPEGSETDHTRPNKNYDTTYEYLKRIGIKEL